MAFRAWTALENAKTPDPFGSGDLSVTDQGLICEESVVAAAVRITADDTAPDG